MRARVCVRVYLKEFHYNVRNIHYQTLVFCAIYSILKVDGLKKTTKKTPQLLSSGGETVNSQRSPAGSTPVLLLHSVDSVINVLSFCVFGFFSPFLPPPRR